MLLWGRERPPSEIQGGWAEEKSGGQLSGGTSVSRFAGPVFSVDPFARSAVGLLLDRATVSGGKFARRR